MRDVDKAHVPEWPKHEVQPGAFREAVRWETHSTANFVWLARGEEHFATVYYDINGCAIGYKDVATGGDKYFIFD